MPTVFMMQKCFDHFLQLNCGANAMQFRMAKYRNKYDHCFDTILQQL